MPVWLSTIITLSAGSLLAIVSGWVSNQWTVGREREARNDLRRDQITLRRHEFKRQTLIALQETIANLGRTSVTIHSRQKLPAKALVALGFPPLSEGLLAQAAILFELPMLAVRAREPDILALADKARDRAIEILDHGSDEEATASIKALGEIINEIHLKVAQLLISLDEAEDSLTSPKPITLPWQR
jgi:hypothetical protein